VLGDTDLAKTIIKIFLKDIPIQIQILKDFLNKNDLAGAERQAHSIKGASANIGGEALRTAASEMEISGKREGGRRAMMDQIPGLIAKFEQLKRVLSKEI